MGIWHTPEVSQPMQCTAITLYAAALDKYLIGDESGVSHRAKGRRIGGVCRDRVLGMGRSPSVAKNRSPSQCWESIANLALLEHLPEEDYPYNHTCSCASCNYGCSGVNDEVKNSKARVATVPLRELLIAPDVPSLTRLAPFPRLGMALSRWPSSWSGHDFFFVY